MTTCPVVLNISIRIKELETKWEKDRYYTLTYTIQTHLKYAAERLSRNAITKAKNNTIVARSLLF